MKKILLMLIFLVTCIQCTTNQEVNHDFHESKSPERLLSWTPKNPLRKKPVIAIIADNYMTELTDFVVPYGILKKANIAEVKSLAITNDKVDLFPALSIKTEETLSSFDEQNPEGADFVIVPAMHNVKNEVLLNWIKAQHKKRANIVGVCDGVWVLAHAGLLKDKEATGFWYSLDNLKADFPDTKWVTNRRYLQDKEIITTTGVTASINVSLALIESIAGSEKANLIAAELGVSDWSPKHDSLSYEFKFDHYLTAAKNYLSFWGHDNVAFDIADGIDEISLALTADIYSRTYKSKAIAVAAKEKIISANGIVFVIDQKQKTDFAFDFSGNKSAIQALNLALDDITKRYGPTTSEFARLQVEYDR